VEIARGTFLLAKVFGRVVLLWGFRPYIPKFRPIFAKFGKEGTNFAKIGL